MSSNIHLADENSAYIRQQIQSQVKWHSFGPEALEKARSEERPIFLSIGHISSYWCSLMSNESFNDPEIAEIINNHFVPILVDRDERPDLDTYFQTASQLFGKGSGWPLTAFTLPDLKPFFVGTYFPKTANHEVSSFKDVLLELKRAFSEEKEKVIENAESVNESIKKGIIPTDKIEFEGHYPHPMSILESLKKFQDEKNGGYGNYPKFPHFPFYEWAVEQILEGMVEKDQSDFIVKSLENILLSSTIDQIRGGVHRCSLSEDWSIPDFEKMLSDQAALLKLLSKFSLIYSSPIVYDALMSTLDYLEKEMLSDKGHMFSGQASYSEDVEGLYHTFSEEEFEDAIAQTDNDELIKEMKTIKDWFCISKGGNFRNGLNVIQLNKVHRETYLTQEGWEKVRKVKDALLNSRKERIPPVSDTKGVASWNFNVISALTDVMQFCRIDVIRRRASLLFQNILNSINENFISSDDSTTMRIKHSTTSDNSLVLFEDYATFANTMIRIYEMSGNETFKNNLLETLNFINKEFAEEDHFLTRSKSQNDHMAYLNQRAIAFDQAYKSPAATILLTAKRASILLEDAELYDRWSNIVENYVNESLKNPLHSGEALRAFTYPIEVMRGIRLPKKWLENDKFLGFMPYFQSRFVFNFNDEENENWEIYNREGTELKGEGVESFIETLTPNAAEKETSEK